MSEMIERVAAAIDAVDVGYRMTLTRLVDGVRTYELVYGGEAPIEFENTDDLYEHVAARKREAMARAAIEALRNPTIEMDRAGGKKLAMALTRQSSIWEAMIDAALADS